MEEYKSPDDSKKYKVLFVCLGNICRSPAAEAILRSKLRDAGLMPDRVEVDSAGIGAWHTGQLPDRRMREHGARRGYDISSRARQVKAGDFGRFDLIFAMDNDNAADLRRIARSRDEAAKILLAADFLSRHPGQTTVPDPYYGGEDDFRLALDLIEDACDGIVKMLQGRLSSCR